MYACTKVKEYLKGITEVSNCVCAYDSLEFVRKVKELDRTIGQLQSDKENAESSIRRSKAKMQMSMPGAYLIN
jgi:hypothetical protein